VIDFAGFFCGTVLLRVHPAAPQRVARHARSISRWEHKLKAHQYDLTRRSLLVAAVAAPFVHRAAAAPRRFVLDDLIRYIAASAAVRNGADPLTTMQAYLDGASDGMRVWRGIYPIEAQKLASELKRRPLYYASLATLPARISALEPEIGHAYDRLEAMHRGASLGTGYFLVGGYTAGGTAREIGTMVAVEFFGRTQHTDMREFEDDKVLYGIDELVQVAVHEGVHNLQRQIQGQENYIAIYVDEARMTLRNFAVREGVADYLTDHITGRRIAVRHAFGDAREEPIWREFRPIMNETILAKPGWFQGAFPDGRKWPNQMGYFVGYKMAEHIHKSAADGDAALIEIMSPHSDPQFQSIADRYAQKFA
jgi:hypothetical protein